MPLCRTPQGCKSSDRGVQRHIHRALIYSTTRSSEWEFRSRGLLGHPILFLDPGAFTGTDRGLLRSVLGPWSPVPKCEAPGAPISLEEHTSMAPRPAAKVRILRFKTLPRFRHDPGRQIPRLRYSPGLAPTTRLNALLKAAPDS